MPTLYFVNSGCLVLLVIEFCGCVMGVSIAGGERLLSVSFLSCFQSTSFFARSTQVGAGYVVSSGSEHKGESLAKKEKQ